jgi:hypothetical protein
MIFVSTALAHPAYSCLKLLAFLFLAFWAITQMQARWRRFYVICRF